MERGKALKIACSIHTYITKLSLRLPGLIQSQRVLGVNQQ